MPRPRPGHDRLRARPEPGGSFRFVNLYGPAETTVMVTYHHVAPGTVDGTNPPIGGPIDNTFPAVVDVDTMDLVPAGAVGELIVGGLGVARGYIGRPDLTAERFVTLDLGGGADRYYRTGDLVRWRDDETLDYVGRTDHQIKVRGFRIEAGEVEAHLRRHVAVEDAVVIGIDGAYGRELGAVVVARDPAGPPAPRELRRFLLGSLPRQMIPTRISFVDHLPITENGKVDRRRLLEAAW